MGLLRTTSGLALMGGLVVLAASAPPPVASAYFGTWNGTTNAAQYDAGAASLTNGTYGEFTVTGGRYIDANIANLSAGSTTVSGLNVVVDANVYAVASDAQWSALAKGNSGVASLAGKIIQLREDVRLTSLSDGTYSAFLGRADVTFRGDGITDVAMTKYHIGNVTIPDLTRLTFDNISSMGIDYNTLTYPRFTDCHFGSNDPDHTFDYSPAGYSTTGLNEPLYNNNPNVMIEPVFDNVTFRGSGAFVGGGSNIVFEDLLWMRGFIVDKFYGDGLSIRCSTAFVGCLAGGLFKRHFGRAAYTNNPHSDSWQAYGTGWASYGWVVEACVTDVSDGSGELNYGAYLDTGADTVQNGHMRAIGVMAQSWGGMRTTNNTNVQLDYLSVIPDSGYWTSGTMGDSFARIHLTNPTGGSLTNSFGTKADQTVYAGSSVYLGGFTPAALKTALPNYDIQYADITYAQALGKHQPAVGEALDGIGVWAAFQTIPTGADLTGYQLKSSVAPDPAAAITAASGTTTTLTATITRTVNPGWITWILVPDTTVLSAADYLDVVSHRVPSALKQGHLKGAGLSFNLSEAVTMTGGSTYTLYAFGFNGPNARSFSSFGFTV